MKKLKIFNKQSWLMNQLRRLSIKYPPRLEAYNKGKIIYYIKSKKGKDMKRVSHSCYLCGKDRLKSSEIEMDHIIPVGSFETWDIFINKLMCPTEMYQKLCISCHEEKTFKETGERKVRRKKKLDKKKKVS